jgi:hypothetical protein
VGEVSLWEKVGCKAERTDVIRADRVDWGSGKVEGMMVHSALSSNKNEEWNFWRKSESALSLQE